MSSILYHIQSRSIRFAGTRCYNERNQPITCPISRVELIALAIFAGLFLTICLTLFICSRCSCRRQRTSMSALYGIDPEFQPTGPPSYLRFHSSTEHLIEPPKIHAAVHPYHRW
ncbi:hypothetical protein DFH06DRAFT_1469177 [Mycena polygramma]|nr:hypothetical protein DFH06DRAFT_1469177 [Mycena polygramma]